MFFFVLQEYLKITEAAEEKVKIASQMSELTEACSRKLDEELAKFKADLEVDKPGVTDMIEKRK